jgi:hypothetical protein
MSMRINIKIHGVEKIKLRAALKKKEARQLLKKALYNGANSISRRAKEILTNLEHIKTGNLRRSIRAKSYVHGVDQFKAVVLAGAGPDGKHENVDYAEKIEALPDGGYFYRAGRELEPKVIANIATIIKGMTT